MNAAALPLQAAVTPDAGWQDVYSAACAPYCRLPGIDGRWAWHWSRGKLAHDPVFRKLLELGLLPPHARVLDIGCGQGLVASLLNACAQVAGKGAWPEDWPAAPSATAYTGIELRARETRRAEAALAVLPFGPPLTPQFAPQFPPQSPPQFTPQFLTADVRHSELPACDLVLILDVLHYVNHAAQAQVLRRVRAALHRSPGPGRLLLRVGDAQARSGFMFSQWADRIVTAVRDHESAPKGGRPLADWMALLRELGFSVKTLPMSQGTPFANVLLVADLRA